MEQACHGNQAAAKVIHDMQNEGNIFLAHSILESAKQTNGPNAPYWMYDTGKGLIKAPRQARIWDEKTAR